ncbi:MAG: TetR/AcrR family transcriptional regulator [Gordonia sp. (in: high G+C Gram-positive bacteria)]|uniref:TetR/AcrR family transcriptional regulator n=1 Tax=Gordonia sp. (in: high G+C Gram-positive bacteria) TaxID=84139 RepID=UPI003BB5675E
MTNRSERAKEALMDAAEELIATLGVQEASDRKICAKAGTANHSSIRYHFGSHDEFLRALVLRHSPRISELRATMVADLPADPQVADYLKCLIEPSIASLRELEPPSWRARFLRQMRNHPAVTTTATEFSREDPAAAALIDQLTAALSHLPADVVRGRSRLIHLLVTETCADFESLVAASENPVEWEVLARFLADAAAGLIAAPSTPDAALPPVQIDTVLSG